jgi:hypothetical protein
LVPRGSAGVAVGQELSVVLRDAFTLFGIRAAASASKEKRGCRAGGVAPGTRNKEIAVSESTQGRPDEADEKAPKPGEQDTETVAGQPKKAPESKDGEQSKQDQ